MVPWGGSYARAWIKGYHERFTAETGIAINLEGKSHTFAELTVLRMAGPDLQQTSPIYNPPDSCVSAKLYP